jgi:hypothetical protein
MLWSTLSKSLHQYSHLKVAVICVEPTHWGRCNALVLEGKTFFRDLLSCLLDQNEYYYMERGDLILDQHSYSETLDTNSPRIQHYGSLFTWKQALGAFSTAWGWIVSSKGSSQNKTVELRNRNRRWGNSYCTPPKSKSQHWSHSPSPLSQPPFNNSWFPQYYGLHGITHGGEMCFGPSTMGERVM